MTSRRLRKDRKLSRVARVSVRVLATLISLTVVIFGAFYLVGYDMPSLDDPRFTAPLLTDMLLWYIYVLVFVTLVITVVSVVHDLRLRAKDNIIANGVRASRIAWLTAALLAVSLVLTFALGSSEPLSVNGRVFSSAIWLRLTDMFINTSIVLFVVAIVAVAFGMTGLNRKLPNRLRR